LLGSISKLSGCLLKKLTLLENALSESETAVYREILVKTVFYRDSAFTAMSDLRVTVDKLETLVSKKH